MFPGASGLAWEGFGPDVPPLPAQQVAAAAAQAAAAAAAAVDASADSEEMQATAP
jgi:hypothetical protein